MSTHTALLAQTPGGLAETTVPTPTPKDGEVLVRVEYTTFVPLDVEIGERPSPQLRDAMYPFVPGFNLAGHVVRVGPGVTAAEFAIGDRVAGFAIPTYGSGAKGAQEFAVLPKVALTKIPNTLSLDDAVTIPDHFATAWWTFLNHLELPLHVPSESAPASVSFVDSSFLIYGAGSTTGQFMVQVLAIFGCRRVIAVASRSNHALLLSLGATNVIDYHDADWTQQVLSASGGQAVDYVVDIIATDKSLTGVATTTDSHSKVAILLPIKFGQESIVSQPGESDARFLWELSNDENPFPKEIKLGYVRTFLYDQNEYLKENLLTKILPSLLESGSIKPVPKRVISEPSGSLTARVNAALDLLRSNAVSGYKLVVKV
ncbi:GroES-like protein [Exidia glandulosa HHB12029]|uniref:GroES-like protein n=1 Tax=Exidia glandulosa HHB12029 TaxID=1314781 RepID=A0A165BY31_EXIGL|nr:GroES-like protein [Exidia glandulosa HHB12029]